MERGLRTLELPWVAQVGGLLEVLVMVPLHLPLGPTEVVRIVGVPLKKRKQERCG